MPFDWSEYFRLASELGTRVDEASLRSAISRAYYYVYHLALERAENNSFTPRAGEGTHTQLWRVYSESPEPACQRLAVIAARLKEKRERADYNSSYVRVREEVPGLLEDAQNFAAGLNVLPARHPDPRNQRS
jgi:uncharacterized protein (UPF0332 family)